jgi:peroxiredoxin Q/BCP
MALEIIGQLLPQLELASSSGGFVKIPDDLLGSYTVLFFYPKNQTPGCTKEACTFRDYAAEFLKLKAKVFGISADSIDSHNRFINKYELNYPLLSDAQKILAKALGVSSFLGILSRDTFLIDPMGKVAKVWRKVSASETALQSLEELKSRSLI